MRYDRREIHDALQQFCRQLTEYFKDMIYDIRELWLLEYLKSPALVLPISSSCETYPLITIMLMILSFLLQY